jgi:hypothetical protein
MPDRNLVVVFSTLALHCLPILLGVVASGSVENYLSINDHEAFRSFFSDYYNGSLGVPGSLTLHGLFLLPNLEWLSLSESLAAAGFDILVSEVLEQTLHKFIRLIATAQKSLAFIFTWVETLYQGVHDVQVWLVEHHQLLQLLLNLTRGLTYCNSWLHFLPKWHLKLSVFDFEDELSVRRRVEGSVDLNDFIAYNDKRLLRIQDLRDLLINQRDLVFSAALHLQKELFLFVEHW